MKKKLSLILSIMLTLLFTACGSPNISGTYKDATEMMGSVAFKSGNTFEMFGGIYAAFSGDLETAWCHGTYSFGDDERTLYFKSDESSDTKIEALGATWAYDKSADVVTLDYEGERYTFYKSDEVLLSKADGINMAENESVQMPSEDNNETIDEEVEAVIDEAVKIPTEDEVIEIAKKHATWIDSWFKNASEGTADIGWECYGPTEEASTDYIQSFDNHEVNMIPIDIPKGSFTGGRGAAGGTSGWYIYEFAYIKTENGYELIDLYREDEADAYSQWLEDDAYSQCKEIINSVLSNPSNVYYLSTDEENWIDFDYSQLGTRYRYYFDNSYANLCIHPSVGYAYCSAYDEEVGDFVDIPLMVNFEVVDIFEN